MFFFFSSRRRHTRLQGDWSSDVCSSDLGTERDRRFRSAYAQAYKLMPDVYAVQGYDAAQMLGVGLKAAGGDIAKKAEFRQAIEKATIPSPRGDLDRKSTRLNSSHLVISYAVFCLKKKNIRRHYEHVLGQRRWQRERTVQRAFERRD